MKKIVFTFCLLFFASAFSQEYNVQYPFHHKSVIYPYAFGVQDMKHIDLDKDGDLDLLIVSNTSYTILDDEILWFENDGKGNFGKSHPISQSISNPRKVEVADMDRDGDLDVVALFDTRGIYWFENDGNQQFEQEHFVFEYDFFNIEDIRVTDFNRDWHMDIIAVYGQRMYFFENEGHAESFSEPSELAQVGSSFLGFYTSRNLDLDKDGSFEMVYYEGEAGEENFIKIHSTKNQELQLLQTIHGIGSTTNFLDLNEDGYLDVLLVRDGKLAWRKNDGTGKLSINKTILEGIDFHHLKVMDIDKDNDQDIVWFNQSGINYLKNVGMDAFGDPSFIDPQTVNFQLPNPLGLLLMEDYDNDGTTDILLTSEERMVWYNNESTEHFTYNNENLINVKVSSNQLVEFADIDKDQDLDIISYGEGELFWFENQGLGNFSASKYLLSTPTDQTIDERTMTITDLDKNGRLDILLSPRFGVTNWLSQTDKLQFEVFRLETIRDSKTKLIPFDIDSDGDIDLISSYHKLEGALDDQSTVYVNDGNQEFAKQHNLVPFKMRLLQLTHLNKDRIPDLVGIRTGPQDDMELYWIKKDEDDNYATLHQIAGKENDNIQNYYIADLDGNGFNDIIYHYESSTREIRCLFNNGDETFNDVNLLELPSPLKSISFADLEPDGDIDIIFSHGYNSSSHKLAYHLNRGNGTFDELHHLINFDEIPSIQVFDYDKDNDMDIILNTQEKKSFHLLLIENLMSTTLIQSTTFFDGNENGIWENNEITLPNQTVILQPDAVISYSDGNGQSTFHVGTGEYQLSYEEQTLWELSTPNSTYSITIDENYQNTNYLFGVKAKRTLHRVYPNITSGITRCRRDVPFWLNYVNTGTTIAQGTISLQADELSEFISADPEPNYEEDGKLFWEIDKLYPTQEQKIKIFFQMPGADAIGENITMNAHVHLVNPDGATVYNKKTEYSSELLCSYDPNDKLAQTEQYGNQNTVWTQDSIYYTIRFQNTGNDTAFTVRITDFLDKHLDWTTFQPLTSSHDMKASLDRNTGLTTFLFENILLPDSTTNEPESHGFVTYSIAPISNAEDKTEINNTAFIYFDFNPPIITNTTAHITTNNPATSITTHPPKLSLNIYPNPTKDHWHVHLQYPTNQNYHLKLLDVTGKLLQSYTNLQNGTNLIERKGLQSGVYFLQLEGDAGKVLGMGKLLVE